MTAISTGKSIPCAAGHRLVELLTSGGDLAEITMDAESLAYKYRVQANLDQYQAYANSFNN
jgi:hypothetical protein